LPFALSCVQPRAITSALSEHLALVSIDLTIAKSKTKSNPIVSLIEFYNCKYDNDEVDCCLVLGLVLGISRHGKD